jgi:hypothetical protein
VGVHLAVLSCERRGVGDRWIRSWLLRCQRLKIWEWDNEGGIMVLGLWWCC